ncbi:MAG: hypothetical protein Q8R82_05780 [Hyphomonadaceae bacterium]|nr:hypothetical protein [Hyphomonadaceae bacterium]
MALSTIRFVAIALLAALAAPALAQQQIPRTADGHPDFQGVWSAKGLTPLERIPGASGLVVGDEEHAKLVGAIRARARSPAMEAAIDPNLLAADVKTLTRVGNEWRSSWITDPPDGKLPLTAEGKRLRDMPYLLTDPEARDSWERCLVGTGRAPMWSVPVENIRQIVQTPANLMIYTEEGADTRIIGIGADHRPAAIKSRLGDSTARWEGDVLVVETLNQIDNYAPFPTMPQSVRVQSRIIEHFSLLSPNEILYRFTIEDPALYSAPWSAEYSLHREHTTAYENGCHEGNYSLPSILRAERLKEARQRKPR